MQRISPDFEGFRLGVQKCRKTIQNACSESVFYCKGSKVLFVLFRRLTDIRAAKKIFITTRPKKKETDDEPLDALARLNRAKNESTSVKVNLSGLTSIVGRRYP